MGSSASRSFGSFVEGAGNRHALSLAAGQRARRGVGSMADGACLQQLVGLCHTLAPRQATTDHRHLDVLACVQRRDEVVELKDEAHRRRPVAGRVRKLSEIRSADGDRARVGEIEGADEVQQRALAAAGRPHDRREVPRLELERDLVECDDAAAFERLRDTVDDDVDAPPFEPVVTPASRAASGSSCTSCRRSSP